MRISVLALSAASLLCLAAKPKAYSRSVPPTKWEKTALSVFERNAYSLLEGERPVKFSDQENKREPEREDMKEANGDFDRTDMMKKLRAAEQTLSESLNTRQSFAAASSKIRSSADLLEMMGRTLLNSDPDYGGEDAYLKQAEEMTAAAKLIKVYVAKGDYDGAMKAFAGVKKSCDKCHQKFR